MKKHIPNTLTCLNLITGALGCITVIEGNYEIAVFYIIISAFFDFLDGFVARLLNVQSTIGKELDSLADMVSFGLLPALYMVKIMENHLIFELEQLPLVGLLIAAFSAIRLAKFNLDTRQSNQFIGLPTPANAIMISSLSFLPQPIEVHILILLVITLISCYLMIAELPMIALKFKGFGWKSNQWRFSLILCMICLIAIFQLAAFPFLIPAYIILSIAENLANSRPFKQ